MTNPQANLHRPIIDLAEAAGRAILAVYERGGAAAQAKIKGDGSPLTAADLAAHACIDAGLAELQPEVPRLSEESAAVPWAQRRTWSRFWLIDPLDGTKEFLARNGEFTVNIALVDDGEPVWGVVHAPVPATTWWGGPAAGGAWRQEAGAVAAPIRVANRAPEEPWRIVASRSHRGPAVDAFLTALGPHVCDARGSSLKICAVAEGSAHCYPRLGPTCMWDTAAAQAVVVGAGGKVFDLDGQDLGCFREELLNPWFIVCDGCGCQPPQAAVEAAAIFQKG